MGAAVTVKFKEMGADTQPPLVSVAYTVFGLLDVLTTYAPAGAAGVVSAASSYHVTVPAPTVAFKDVRLNVALPDALPQLLCPEGVPAVGKGVTDTVVLAVLKQVVAPSVTVTV